jgi:hypothetical protein
MGFSTPKDPFDLTAFLSQKGVPRSKLRPRWKRLDPAPTPPAATDGAPPEDAAPAAD